MDDRKLAEIQDQLMKELDTEVRVEEEIVSSSKTIAEYLMSGKPCRTDLDGTPYMFKYRLLGQAPKQFIFMLIVNEVKYKIAQEKYKPFTATAEVDNQYTLLENLQATVEAFIRHKSGRIKPEMLSNEEAYRVEK
jgi:hypothetical protein